MTTIDEILKQARHLALVTSAADRAGKWPSTEKIAARDGAENSLRTLITQAIAEARADGAREMREAANALCEEAEDIFPPSGRGRQSPLEASDVVEWYSESIRALPLPDKREPVRLTDERIGLEMVNIECKTLLEFARAIETAVLAANGLTK